MSSQIINKEFVETAKKSVKALKAHVAKSSIENDSLYLIVNTETPLLSKKDYTQRIVPIPHKFKTEFEQNRILIITKDNSNLNNFVELLKPLTTKYENVELISIKKIRKMSTKTHQRLVHDYDYVICDYRIQKLLPDILGATFYQRNKKIPFILQLSKELYSEKAKLIKPNLKKEEVDLNYIMKQLKSIVFNTSFLLSTDSNITIKAGETSQSNEELSENITQILKYLTNNSNTKITNWNSKKNKVKSILVKATESASLPLYKASE